MDYRSLPDMLRTNSNRYNVKAAMLIKRGDTWEEISYSEFGDKVRLIAEGLVALGAEKGDKVALLSENRPEWSMSDFAIQSVGALVVTVYPTLIPKQIEYWRTPSVMGGGSDSFLKLDRVEKLGLNERVLSAEYEITDIKETEFTLLTTGIISGSIVKTTITYEGIATLPIIIKL